MTTAAGRLYGVMGEARDADDLLRLAARVRARGFSRWDAFSPHPIHGMDTAMGLERSPIGKVAFCGGAAGALVATLLQLYPALVEYPQIVHGKPQNLLATPAFFPILFELTILFAALACLFGMLILTRLPRLHHPVFDSPHFHRASDDAFFVVIEASDPQFSEADTARWLEENGARNVHLIRET